MTDALQPVQQGMSNTILLDLDTSSVINACDCDNAYSSFHQDLQDHAQGTPRAFQVTAPVDLNCSFTLRLS